MAVPNITNPAVDIVPVTPSDSLDLSEVSVGGETLKCRGLLIATAGAIKITTVAGSNRTITVPAGYLMVEVKRVWSTGTTSTGISAIY